MTYEIETEQEADGRWVAEIKAIPGALVYGQTKLEALQRVQALALRVMADRLEHAEANALVNVTFRAA